MLGFITAKVVESLDFNSGKRAVRARFVGLIPSRTVVHV